MALIHMDVDEVRSMAARLRNQANIIDDHISTLRAEVTQMEWQGRSRDQFIDEVYFYLDKQKALADTLKKMAICAERKANQWETVASIFAGPFPGIQLPELNFSQFINFFNNIKFPDLTFANLKDLIPGIFSSSLILPSLSLTGVFSKIELPWKELHLSERWPPFLIRDKAEIITGNNNEQDISQVPDNQSTNSSPEINVAPQEYPKTLREHKLQPANPSDYGKMGCVKYAKARRPDLGSTQCENERYADGAAANYISKYEDTAFQINGNDGILSNILAPGYAVVWEPGVQNANKTYGHVAIIEEVGPDYVVVSHASWGSEQTTRFSLAQLKELWIIP